MTNELQKLRKENELLRAFVEGLQKRGENAEKSVMVFNDEEGGYMNALASLGEEAKEVLEAITQVREQTDENSG